MKDSMLDERLAWPRRQWQHGGPWRLGHGLTVVGPGWHPLVRAAFAAVAEVAGATVIDVRQKCAVLEIRAHHPDASVCDILRARMTALTEASRSLCEGCGAVVPTLPCGQGLWRLHCAQCTTLVNAGGRRRERRLWETRAQRKWPKSELW